MSDYDDLKLGFILIIQDEADASPLPLENTAVTGEIFGAVASVTVEQQFGNPFDTPIELRYLFPLPEKAAIVDYEISIGERTISAELKEKQQAQQTYQQAIDNKKRASLLTQERPNLFAIQIAHVQPGESIITRIQYEDRLTYSDGAYEFVFPMGITPRYHSLDMAAGDAKSVDAPIALDENKVAPVSIVLTLDAGLPVSAPISKTHELAITQQADNHYSLELVGEHNIPNKDFVLRYDAAEDDIRSASWSSKDDEMETLLLTIIPPRLDITKDPAAREFIFVVDRSGSMGGDPMNQAKNALRASLRTLNETDTFAILAFDNRLEWFDQQVRSVTQDNIEQADSWIQRLTARGGTEIRGAIDAALGLSVDAERQRYVVFLTDGAVSADEESIRKINKQRGDARIFTFGIGASVNRYLLTKMAEMGRGVAEFLGNQDDIEKSVTRFQDRVSYPALMDASLTWEHVEHWDTYPEPLPDIYIGQALEISSRLKRKGYPQLTLTGTQDGQQVSIPVQIPTPTEPNPVIRRLHARARIESLMDNLNRGENSEKIREQILGLALEHRIVTAYTSFVAVDSEVTDNDHEMKKVNVSVPLPDGLELEGFMGGGQMAFAAMAPSPYSPLLQQRSPRRLLGGLFNRKKRQKSSFDNEKMTVRSISPMFQDENTSSMRDASDPSLPNLDKMSPEELLNWAESQSEEPEPQMDYMEAEPAAEAMPSPDFLMGDSYTETVETFNNPTSRDEAIQQLARTNNVNGSRADDVELTAATLLAFVRAGHTTRAGDYRRQVNKMAAWLQKKLSSTTGLALMLTVRALDELHAKSGDYAISDDVRTSLPEAANDLEKAAHDDKSVTVPSDIKTYDDLRIVALLQGDVTITEDLFKTLNMDVQNIMPWLAIGQPE
ncbi:MAG: VIT and vWA domain-containing protein [Aggregatilineales bacterium]